MRKINANIAYEKIKINRFFCKIKFSFEKKCLFLMSILSDI